MKGFFVSLNLILAALLVTTVVLADDVEDIKALEMEVRVQESAGNTAGFYQYMTPEFTIFPLRREPRRRSYENNRASQPLAFPLTERKWASPSLRRIVRTSGSMT